MSKWFGNIGYATTTQTEPGVWEKVIEEKGYYGDITNNRFLHQNSGEVNDNITLSNVVSIIADPFAYKIVQIWHMCQSWVLNGKLRMLKFNILD